MQLNILPPSQIPKATAILAKNALGQSTGPDEFVMNRRDGRQVILAIKTFPVKIKNKTLVLAIARDITKRKQAEEMLREEKNKAQKYLDVAGVILVVIDAHGKVSLINKRGCEVLEYRNKEVVGKNWFDNFIPERVKNELKAIFQKLMSGEIKPVEYYENPILTKSGKERVIAWYNTVLKDEKGNISATLSSGEDVTERKQMEEALRESEQNYRTIFETTGTATVIIEEDTTISLVNTEFEKLSGYSNEEVEGKKSWTEFVVKDDLERMEKYHRLRRVDPNAAPRKYEFRFIDREGKVKDVFLTIAMIPGTKKSVVSLLDITKRKKAEKGLQQSFERVEKILQETISTLALTVEMRDPYTAGHQRRVTQLACAIAKEMGLSEKQINGLHFAGTIHDLGKTNIPAEILSKPGRLTEIEFTMVKNHPQVGHNILKGMSLPWPAAQIILQHHERMDGSGYPQGLSGEDILLEARILGVADVVEAMSSHRPYRPAHGIDKALEEISQNRAVLYDPKVVDACLRLFAEKGFQFE